MVASPLNFRRKQQEKTLWHPGYVKFGNEFCSVFLSDFLDTFEEVKANEQVGWQIYFLVPKNNFICLHHLPLILKIISF